MVLLITVDTEPDDQWSRGNNSFTLENIKALPRFQRLCSRFSIRPTYLVTSTLANDAAAQEILGGFQRNGEAEIGTHLHPWETAPFVYKDNPAKYHGFPCEFSDNILREKLVRLTGQIEYAFGKRPTSYRSGRYGICGRQVKILDEMGYKIDGSVTPFISWRRFKGLPQGSGGPDFSRTPLHPYHPSYDNICKEGEAGLWEVPITIQYTGRFKNIAPLILRITRLFQGRFSSRIESVILGRYQPRWLRPFPWQDLDDLFDVVKRSRQLGLPHLQLLIHSSELAPTSSLYTKNKNDVEDNFRMLDGLFAFLSGRVEGLTMSEYADRLTSGSLSKSFL